MPTTVMSFVRPHWLTPSMLMLASGLGERIERLDRVVLRAEQALLLGGDHQEQDRALRLRLDLRERPRDLEQRRDARGVVERAVVDLVAVDRRRRRRGDPSARCRRRTRS